MQIRVNGESCRVDAAPDTPLLYVLRNQLGFKGPRFGCGLGQCGSCKVLVDGRAVPSCRVPVGSLKGEVTTLEGLPPDHPVTRAFVEEQAAGCGYCLNGMVMAAAALLQHNPRPTDGEIRDALRGNLCRCGTHARILRAVHRAAG